MPAITAAVENGNSRPDREAMSQAALLSGMALANSGLGMAHGVAAALGTHCRVPHGVACALMLPVAIRVNMDVCRAEFAQLRNVGTMSHHNAPRLRSRGRRSCGTSKDCATASTCRGGFRNWASGGNRSPRSCRIPAARA